MALPAPDLKGSDIWGERDSDNGVERNRTGKGDLKVMLLEL